MNVTIRTATAATFGELMRWRYPPPYDVLNVAAFGERAIAVYERGGFVRTGSHVRTFERWGAVDFVEMQEAR